MNDNDPQEELDTDLQRLIDECCVSIAKDDADIVTTMPTSNQFWKFKEDCAEYWYGAYCRLIADAIEDGSLTKRNICIAERIGLEKVPLFVDLPLHFGNISYLNIDTCRVKFQAAIRKAIAIAQTILRDKFAIGDEIEAVALISKVPAYTANSAGVFCRIQFPNIVLHPTGLKEFERLFPNALGKYMQEIFASDEEGDAMILTPFKQGTLGFPRAKNLLPLYGSDMILFECVNELDLAAFNNPFSDFCLSADRCTRVGEKVDKGAHKYALSADPFRLEDAKEDVWLPIYCSVHYQAAITALKSQTCSEYDASGSRKYSEDMDMCLRFLSMLSVDKWTTESTCMEIGKALFNACNGDINIGFPIWTTRMKKAHEIIKDVPSFVPKDAGKFKLWAQDLWLSKFPDSKITYKTLAWYACMDNREMYTKWHDEWYMQGILDIFDTVKKKSDLGQRKVANAIYRCYWLEFAYDKEWFQFKNHRWINGAEHIMANRISEHFLKILMVTVKRLNDPSIEKNHTKEEVERRQNMAYYAEELINLLDGGTFLDKVTKRLINIFAEVSRGFRSNLDENTDLMGCATGVLDTFGTEGIVFRPGKPEDFISKTTGIHFYPNLFHENNPQVRKVAEWIEQVYPDEELRVYFYKYCASFIKGRNRFKKFGVMNGKGDNSKSMIIKLLEYTFREYCAKGHASMLNTDNKKSSSNASPEFARLKGCRILILDEGSDKEMDKTVIKLLTGDDKVYVRALYSDGMDMVQQYKTVLVTNQVPRIRDADAAAYRRMALIMHLSTWIHGAPIGREEQFQARTFEMNDNFSDEIPSLTGAFMWLLVTKWYRRLCEDGLAPPPIVVNATQEYIRGTDVYEGFIRERVEKTDDDNDKMYFSDAFEHFKEWYLGNFSKKCHVERQLFRISMMGKFGDLVEGKFWTKYLLVDPMEEENERDTNKMQSVSKIPYAPQKSNMVYS